MENILPRIAFLQWLRRPEPWITLVLGLTFYCMAHSFEGRAIDRWPYQPLMGQTAFLVCLLGMVAAVWRWHSRDWVYWLMVNLFALGHGCAFLLVWQGYGIGPSGIVNDAWFQTAMVIKFRAGMGDVDFAYKGLHAFYPPLYPWVVGKLGQMTATPALQAMKFGLYWTAFLLPMASYGLWRKLLPQMPAFIFMVMSMAFGRLFLPLKPFEVIGAIVFLPWALYYVAGLRLQAAPATGVATEGGVGWELQPLRGREWLWGGLIGGLIFMTYYYYFFLLVVWLPLQAVVEWWPQGGWRAVWARLRMLGLLLLVMMAVSAVYWLPLLADGWRHGMVSYQNRWFQFHMIHLPLDVVGQWRELLGLLGLLAFARRKRLARSAVLMLLAVLAYFLLAQVALYNGMPLLHFRMIVLEEALLGLGFVLVLVELWRLLREHVAGPWEMALPVAMAVLLGMNITLANGYEVNTEEHVTARDFATPPLVGVPAFAELSRGKVFLTNRLELAALKPLYLWVCPNAHYNHPAARYRERLRLLLLLQHACDSDFVAWMLQHNRYDRLDYLVLDNNSLSLWDDNFPAEENHLEVPIAFDSIAFTGRFWQRHASIGELVAAREVPVDLWRGFSRGERHVAALFCDVPALRASIPAADLQALDAELAHRRLPYSAWVAGFFARWGDLGN